MSDGLKQASDVLASISAIGEQVGPGIGGIAGTIVTVTSVGLGIVAALLRTSDPVVKITRLRSAIEAAHNTDKDVDAIIAAEEAGK